MGSRYPEGHAPRYWKNHPEALQAARVSLSEHLQGAADLRKREEPPKRHPVSEWFAGVSGIGLLAGLGGSILSPFFWPFTTLIYISLLVLCADVWFYPRLRSAHAFWRITLVAVFITIGVAFSMEVVFLPAPLNITTYARLGNYGPGAKIYGKEWNPGWIDLRVRINPPTYDYSDLDVQITPDLYRADEPWQATKIPCEPFQETKLIPVRVTPVNPSGPVEESETIGPTVRMRCPNLPNRSAIEIVIPLKNLVPDNIPGDELTVSSPLPPGVEPVVLIEGPKKFPDSVKISGTYKVRGRPHEFSGTYKPQALE